MSISGRLARSQRRNSSPADSPVEVDLQGLIALRREARGFLLKPNRIRSSQAGRYISPYIGRGMTFAESRPYQPGDDVRHMDWRIMARTGKPHSKLFQEERERSILVWVDFRATMFFATRGRFKSVQAARGAAWIAWAARLNNDRIGGLLFSENNHWELRPRTGDKAVLRLIHALCEGATLNPGTPPAQSESNPMTQALVRLRRVTKPGSQIFLLSDFRNLDKTGEAHLQQLSKHNEIILLSLYDPLEKALPVAGLYPVDLGNGNQILNTANPNSRRHYASQFDQRQTHLENLSRRLAATQLTLSTQDEIVSTLQTTFQT
ncbi:MAG: DUF58 domain-containing protein [Magnetococcales bacterium]|nr:DUF58 domain-containing protein [Magnetococcales bacterium]